MRAIEDSDDDGRVHRARVGSRFLGVAPDLDPRTYGCCNSSALVTKSGGFEVGQEPGKLAFNRRKPSGRMATGRLSACG